ncbi:MAG: Tfp pilus assembly PilM family ATPase [Candidatus Latescibacterota bacterium]
MFGFKAKSATGIYMAGDRAWLASLRQNRHGVEPLTLVECRLPSAVNPGVLNDEQSRSALAAALAKVGDEYEIDFAHTCFSLDRSLVLLKRSLMVPGGDKAMREHMHWEAEQFFEGDGEEFSIDCLLASEWGVLVAARHSALDCYLALGEEAGMGEIDVDVASFALYNAGECGALLPSVECELLVYMGQSESHMLLVENGEPLEVAVDSWGGEDSADEIVITAAQNLSQEAEGGIDRVWCAGPDVDGWSAKLATELGCEMSVLDPLAAVDEEHLSDEVGPSQRSAYAVAVGLAQRGLAS